MMQNPIIKLPVRWTPLVDHPTQIAAFRSRHRFNVIPAGRRSGKTEIVGKRKMALRCILCHDAHFPQYFSPFPDPKFFISAPTRDQVKRIYWQDMKSLIPREVLAKPPNESNLILTLLNGAELYLLGLDKPERIEGSPWDHGLVDEIGNVKPNAWQENIRPALSDRRGGCDFIGVPEGRNHYYDMWDKALKSVELYGEDSEWGAYHWISADILPASEIRAARDDLDELVYQQEYEASFVVFAGMAYYNFERSVHVSRCSQFYNDSNPLLFTFDFNVAPGTAAVIQEMNDWPEGRRPANDPREAKDQTITSIIGEVFIPRSSNTERVCRKLIDDWGDHKGMIYCYGDATGGASGSAKVKGSDWDLIRAALTRHYGEDRVKIKVKRANPRERQRVNAVNSRSMNMEGDIHLQVDGAKAPRTVEDFEGTRIIEGSAGEIDKKSTPMLTHLTDGIGYYIAYKFPVVKGAAATGY